MLVALVTGVAMVVIGVRASLTAERHLHAMLNAIGACYAFVEQNDGDWPRSWPDVEPLFPDDRDWVRQVAVHIDFDADPADLAIQDCKSFTGIRVAPPIYFAYEGQLNALIGLLRRHHVDDDP